MYYFISDTHFGHQNIIKYCDRPFLSLTDMDLVLIRNWNERVQKTDTVFFLGDFCLSKSSEAPNSKNFDFYRQQLNGNIIFISGNHDNRGNKQAKTIITNIGIFYGNENIFLTHNPKYINLNYKFNFVGHVHNKWKFQIINKCIVVNLSVEQWNYHPVTINEIMSAYHQWRKQSCEK